MTIDKKLFLGNIINLIITILLFAAGYYLFQWEITIVIVLVVLMIVLFIIGVKLTPPINSGKEEIIDLEAYKKSRMGFWEHVVYNINESIKIGKYGSNRAQMKCPFCHSDGLVRIKTIKDSSTHFSEKRLSLYTRKTTEHYAHCENCYSSWKIKLPK